VITVGDRHHGAGECWTFQNWWLDEREGKYLMKEKVSTNYEVKLNLSVPYS
jgi:hypothetical protein